MLFFCYHRDRPGSGPLRQAMVEEHWSYMDAFADRMVARGPTFDGDTPTGSVHVVDLSGPEEARRFAFDEPGYQAGAYRDVLLRRFENRLGRTMWEYAGGRDGDDRFLVLGLGPTGVDQPRSGDDLILHGPLLSDDGETWVGTAVLVRADSVAQARAVLSSTAYAAVEVHSWSFGGRPG